MLSDESLDVARRATAVYERLKPLLEADYPDKFIAIEPTLGGFYVGDTMSEATASARTDYPDRLTLIFKVGGSVAIHMGVSESAPWMRYAGMVDSGDPQSSRRIDEVVYHAGDE